MGTHEERGKGRALDAEARNERNDKKRKDIEGEAAAAWPHLRSAAKIPHEDGEDDEQTETRPGKRVRQNNQPEPGNPNQMSLPYAQTPGAYGGNTINPQVDNPYAAPNFQTSQGYRGNSFNQQVNNYPGPSFQEHQGHGGNTFKPQPNFL